MRPLPVEKPSDFRLVKNADIIGVFSKAIYAEADKEVFVIHDRSWGYVPFGIAVDGIEEFIKNGGFEVGGSIEIEPPSRKKADYGVLSAPSADRIAEVERIIAESGSTGGIIECYNTYRSAKNNIAALFSALCSGKNAAEYAVKLIGLGRGLTPSGDDFLAGMFSLLFAAGTDIAAVAEAVKANLDRTSKISGAYLAAVLDGEHFTIYEHAVKALLGDGDVKTHTDFVLPLGASSGTDTLCGALFAAKVIARENKGFLS